MRLFFALEITAPWPEKLPPGKVLDPLQRHMTLLFLGDADETKLLPLLPQLPLPSFPIGLIGQFDSCLPLARALSWHVDWAFHSHELQEFQRTLMGWLQAHNFAMRHRNGPLLPHVTICRPPFDAQEWQQTFQKIPLMASHLHLYESLGSSHYHSLWRYNFCLPFEEIEHTADIAFLILGEDLEQLYTHALYALAFRFPPLLAYFPESREVSSWEEIVKKLNSVLTRADSELGCPFKAISFHGGIEKLSDGLLRWEMIVDV